VTTRVVWFVALAAFVAGAAATWYYAQRGLTLSHYDAKGHLVVARRIFDSLTPGWRQVGAVWLPLPHLLNALPVQVDAWYRTGASGVFISLVSFVVATSSLAWVVLRATGSAWAAAAAAVVLGSDPNLLYLQATPMTEPLLLAAMALATALTWRWVSRESASPHAAGAALAAACLTRYEAWPFAASLVALVSVATFWAERDVRSAWSRAWPLGAYFLVTVVAFLCLSRATVGEWFVTGGFFVTDKTTLGQPVAAATAVLRGVNWLQGWATLAAALVGFAALLVAVARDRRRAPALVALALVACAALPWYAFYEGHPFRIRYMVVLAAAVAAVGGMGLGMLPRRLGAAAATVFAAAALVQTPPISANAPMVQEAQWDVPNSLGRQAVTACLSREFVRPGVKILASMRSLAHYMQELSRAGFALDDFVHEGIGELWPEALRSPRRHVRWVLFEEVAEGGDMLTALRTQDPAFVDGFDRVCSGGGVALYRRR
jgi:hypothetical protein